MSSPIVDSAQVSRHIFILPFVPVFPFVPQEIPFIEVDEVGAGIDPSAYSSRVGEEFNDCVPLGNYVTGIVVR